jgi:nitrate reductase assembly molybdenum cofactor insertion protein NarJ
MSSVCTPVADKRVMAQLAPLLRYPHEPLHTLPAFETGAVPHDAEDALRDFLREISLLSLGQQQSLYTDTFDLAPVCSPYLGVHLFDEESRDRARLMVGLRMNGVEGPELPDHVAEVLGFASRFNEEDWGDLVELVLLPALTRMEEILRPSANPYRHLIAAAAALCRGGPS